VEILSSKVPYKPIVPLHICWSCQLKYSWGLVLFVGLTSWFLLVIVGAFFITSFLLFNLDSELLCLGSYLKYALKPSLEKLVYIWLILHLLA